MRRIEGLKHSKDCVDYVFLDMRQPRADEQRRSKDKDGQVTRRARRKALWRARRRAARHAATAAEEKCIPPHHHRMCLSVCLSYSSGGLTPAYVPG